MLRAIVLCSLGPFLFGLCSASVAEAQIDFRRGDLNSDHEVSLTDLSFLMAYLFADGAAPSCLDRADANDDGRIDIADVTSTMATVLLGDVGLPEPFSVEGPDPTLDDLPCEPGPAGEVLGSEIDHVFFSFDVEGGTGPALAPGQDPAIISLRLDTQESLRGFTLVVAYDPAVIETLEFCFDRGVAEDYDAELRVATTTRQRDGVGGLTAYAIGHVLLEALPPFAVGTFPPGSGYHIADLDLSVADDAEVGTTTLLRFGSSPTIPGIKTELIESEFQALAPLTADVALPLVSPEALFVRGDVNDDGMVDLGDVIVLLGAVLAGGESSACEDAMDVDDTGTVDLADPIRLLELLFAGDPSLAVPYPWPGVDATDDGLTCGGTP